MVIIDQEKCIGCGLCAADCVDSRIRLEEGKAVGPESCIECGHCLAICPRQAVRLEGYDNEEAESLQAGPVLDPEALLQAIKGRRSIRQYTEKKIGQEELERVIEAARYTATAKNRQGSSYVFIQERLEEFKDLVWNYIAEKTVGKKSRELDMGWMILSMFYRRKKKDPSDDFLFRNAPSVMVVVTDNLWDAGMEAQNMENMAVSLGMGVLFNGFLTGVLNGSEELKEWMGISGKNAAAVMLMGYPAVKYQRSVPRKPAELILR